LKSEQAEIILRAKAGDLEAFRQLHVLYGRRILNFIYRMVESREDAEDLSQNVFFIAFHELGELQQVSKFESWLYRIARNEVYQSFRRKRGEPQTPDSVWTSRDEHQRSPEPADLRPTPHDNILNQELGHTIKAVLSALPPKQREVFVLAVIHEMSYAEISEIVGRSLLSVKTDIFRARSRARKALSNYLD
jgi:RNA polymerase sigma-70 factor (ECF subfamily)